MTDRITPLPWKVKGSINEAQTQVYMDNESGWVCSTENMYGEKSKQAANAAYIVHCANNYPKLEAINAELVEFLERLQHPSNRAFMSVEMGTLSEQLLEKAKGVAND